MAEEEKSAPETETEKKIPLQVIRGLPFPASFLQPSGIENVIALKPRDTDIFVVTYPKCGTTWAQFIVWEILHKGAAPPNPNKMMFHHFPFLEFCGTDTLEDIPSPRTMKTHLPFNLQPYNPKAKYIYIVRNPWDCCVSYFYHILNDPSVPKLTFDEFFELFITGEVPWGDFFDHILSWYEHRNDPNVLFLTYEYMKKDKRTTLLGIAKFLGDCYFEMLQDEEVLEKCLKHTDFKYMKELGMFFPKATDTAGLNADDLKQIMIKLGNVDHSTANDEEYTEINFFRKGEIGDWKNHFSPVQMQQFSQYMLRKLTDTPMENFWQPLEEETIL